MKGVQKTIGGAVDLRAVVGSLCAVKIPLLRHERARLSANEAW